MRLNKKMVFMMMVLVFHFILSGCSVEGLRPADATVEKRARIAVITKSTSSNFWKTVFSGAYTAAIEYNVDVVCEGPQNEEDYDTQNEMLEKAIDDQVDAIVFSAIDYNQSVDLVEEAYDQGIPVVIIDSDINTDKVDAHIGTDNYDAGRQAGEELLRQTGDDLVPGVVNFDPNSFNGQERQRGFMDVIREYGYEDEISVVNVDSNIPDASAGTHELLKHHPDINGIVTFNEWTTLGVGYAIQELQKKDEITVVGFDNNTISIGMLETGEMDALIVQNTFSIGYLGVETAYQLITGKEIPSHQILTETLTATRDNLFEEASQKLIFPFR